MKSKDYRQRKELAVKSALSQAKSGHQTGKKMEGVAWNGRKGKKLIAKVQPDLLFLDVEMPDMTGVENKVRLLFVQIGANHWDCSKNIIVLRN